MVTVTIMPEHEPELTSFYIYEHERNWIPLLIDDPDVAVERVDDPDEIVVAKAWLEPLTSAFTRSYLAHDHADGIVRVVNRSGLDLDTATDLVGRLYSYPFSDSLMCAIIDRYGTDGYAMGLYRDQWVGAKTGAGIRRS